MRGTDVFVESANVAAFSVGLLPVPVIVPVDVLFYDVPLHVSLLCWRLERGNPLQLVTRSL